MLLTSRSAAAAAMAVTARPSGGMLAGVPSYTCTVAVSAGRRTTQAWLSLAMSIQTHHSPAGLCRPLHHPACAPGPAAADAAAPAHQTNSLKPAGATLVWCLTSWRKGSKWSWSEQGRVAGTGERRPTWKSMSFISSSVGVAPACRPGCCAMGKLTASELASSRRYRAMAHCSTATCAQARPCQAIRGECSRTAAGR